jgi:hypothetical protein
LIARAVPLLLVLLTTGCRQLLDIPSDVSDPDGGAGEDDDGPNDGGDDLGTDDGSDDDDDGSRADAGPGPDGGGGDGGNACVGDKIFTTVGFDDPDELDSWLVDIRFGCELAVDNGLFVARQVDPPGFCRAFRDFSFDMRDYGLQLQLADPGSEQMSMVFSVILHDGGADLADRRRLRIERDGGVIKLGECVGEVCDTAIYGTFPYNVANHLWWRIEHDGERNTAHFTFASQNEMFSQPTEALDVPDITPALVGCVGVELGTYESKLSDSGQAAFDFLGGGGNN